MWCALCAACSVQCAACSVQCAVCNIQLDLQIDPREVPVVELYPGSEQTITEGESVLFQVHCTLVKCSAVQ